MYTLSDQNLQMSASIRMVEERSIYFTEALEENILVRLPVKSILRLESVCKRWSSLFRSKSFKEYYFGYGHRQVSIPTTRELRLIYPELKPRSKRCRSWRRSSTWAIGPLSNGIYALISVWISSLDSRRVFLHPLKIALFNPATRRLKFAPPFPDEYLPVLTGISSHPCKISCGIDNDYRVVVLIDYENSDQRLCFLVFFYTGEHWERLVDYNPGRRKIGLPHGADVFDNNICKVMKDAVACPQKLFNGCWHWMIWTFDDVDFQFGVLSFDFEKKALALTHGPPCMVAFQADLFVLQDQLAAMIGKGEYNLRFQIWIKMRDPETTWYSVYDVDPVQQPVPGSSILHGIDYYYSVQEPELIRIKSVTLFYHNQLVKLDDNGGQQVEEDYDPSNQIPLSVAGISTFRPTLEQLPDWRQSTVDYAKSSLEWKSD